MNSLSHLKQDIAKAIARAYKQGAEPELISSILSEAVIIALPTHARRAYLMGEVRKGDRLWRYELYACMKEEPTDGETL